ncbi:MAG: 30S ribosomal protein S16 [Endomicrobiales bacterium]|nr:30S ribosomal protein S16 [Endomicrobiales bacterium]
MAVRLRLQRLGKPHKPYYRLVAIDKRAKRDGRPIEILGQYDPQSREKKINIKAERLDWWLKQGAQPSETVASIIRKASKPA